MRRPRLLIFDSGDGSNFEQLFRGTYSGELEAEIVAVVSDGAVGGVRDRANCLGVPFSHFNDPVAAKYQKLAEDSEADFFALLSDWPMRVEGLDLKTRFSPKTVFRIHPGPFPDFGRPGMYGFRVHEAVAEALKKGRISETELCMHFVTVDYRKSPVFLRIPILLSGEETPASIAVKVNSFERAFQTMYTNMVVTGSISWNGSNHKSLSLPKFEA